MKKGMLLVLSMILIFIQVVSAGIYFSQPESIYNVGGMIDINIDVDPVVEGYLLKVNLFCNDNSVIEFNNLPENRRVNIKLPLNFYTIKEFNGDCYFLGEYAGEVRRSNKFEISKKLKVQLSTDSYFANPGEEIKIEGTVKRLSGENINGGVEVSIPLLNLGGEAKTNRNAEDNKSQIVGNNGIFYSNVIDGQFSIDIFLSEDTPARDYRLDILVYEEINNKKASEGVVIANLKVFQVLNDIEVALNEQNLDPGAILNFKSTLLDQSGSIIHEEVSVKIINEKLEKVFERIVQSDETIGYNTLTNLSSGYYEIQVSSGEINNTKKFYINEKAIASFDITDGFLRVTNVGNIPYKKDIQVELNGETFIKKVNLDLGEVQEFKLTGDGDYEVKVSDMENEITKSNVVLTGSVVDVREVKDLLRFKTPIIWIFFIIILGAGVLFLFRNIFKKKSFAFPFSEKFSAKKSGNAVVKEKKAYEGAESEQKKMTVDELKRKIPTTGEAEQVLVLKGHKNRAAVVALKIKNKIGKLEKQSLEKSIEHVYQKKGAVYEQGDYIFIVFSPLMTKTFKNESEAARTAEIILLVLKEHNKKFKNKIEFGIGVNSGEIINKVEDKKLKFTALGSLISSVKRLAEASNEQILISKSAYENGISEIKAEKRKISNGEVYELRKVVNNEKNKEFIKGFLERMRKEQKKEI